MDSNFERMFNLLLLSSAHSRSNQRVQRPRLTLVDVQKTMVQQKISAISGYLTASA